ASPKASTCPPGAVPTESFKASSREATQCGCRKFIRSPPSSERVPLVSRRKLLRATRQNAGNLLQLAFAKRFVAPALQEVSQIRAKGVVAALNPARLRQPRDSGVQRPQPFLGLF